VTISADFTEMTAAARLIDELTASIAAAVAATCAASHDLDLAGAAALDPVGGARIEWRLLAARDGPDGLRVAGLELSALRGLLLAAIGAYRAADQLRDDAQTALARNPWLVDGTIRAITGVTGMSEQRITGLIAELYPDGRPRVRLVSSREGDRPPQSIADVLAGLARRSDISNRWSAAAPRAVAELPDGADDGTIDVRRLTGPRGTAWLVDLPGTSRWDLPGADADPHREHDPADFGGDIRLMAGESTAYERGVVEALQALPIRPGEPVLLAGHSEGGMVAMAAAGVLVARGVNVTSVLTAGSPVAGMRRPPGVDVLSLDNIDDIVPRLSGGPDPRSPEWATLTFSDQLDRVGANHSYLAYGRGARLADRSDDPAVRRWRDRAAPFLTGTSCRTWAFRIQRVP